MKKVLVLIAIAFAIAAGATAFTIVNPNQAFACDEDHQGSQKFWHRFGVKVDNTSRTLPPERGRGVPGDIISKYPGDFVGILGPPYSKVFAYPSERSAL